MNSLQDRLSGLNARSVRSQHSWINEARFEPLGQKETLSLVFALVEEEVRLRIRNGGKPVAVVFDLDSTLFDVKPRSMRILKEFALTEEAQSISAEICSWCLGLEAHRLLYTLEESARANGMPLPKGGEEVAKTFLKAAFRYWRDRFFTHGYLSQDRANPGAVDFVQGVVDRGAQAVYLTGRDWPGMGRGTEAMLEQLGFPWDNRHTRLLMKPNSGLDDSEFKDDALRELRTELNAVALFDNEPANFSVFEKNFPEAALVFYHSNCSQKEARPVRKIYRIESFVM
jgi:phosphoserine phosphatase